MKRSTVRWTTALTAAALLSLPAGGWAKTPPTPQQPAPSATANAQASPAQEHLKQAKDALESIDPAAVTGRAKSQISDLKKRLSALERAATATPPSTVPAGQPSSARSRAARNGKWASDVAEADRILAGLIDTPAAAPDPAATAGTAGTAKPANIVSLDDATKAKLSDVRKHITAFAAAMSGTNTGATPPPATPDETAAAAAATAAATPPGTTPPTPTPATPTPATPTPATPAPATPAPATAAPAPSQPPSTTAQPPSSTEPQSAASGDVNKELARRTLTEARDTLSQLTQLPAAAQLTGDARTQVSQLIANFNELITTPVDWKASYAKVAANMTALLGPENATDEPTKPAPPASTAGAVGTAGTTAAVPLDAAVKAKLIELRTQLTTFEKASGAAPAPAASAAPTPSASPTPSAAPMPTGTSGTTPAPTATPAPTSPATPSEPASAQQPRPSSPPTSPAATQPSAKTEEMGHGEAMRHIEAIEAILSGRSATAGTTGTTGGTTPPATAPATLDRAKIAQVKTHLAELKKLMQPPK